MGQSFLCRREGVGHVFFFFFNHISKCSGPLHWKCFLGYPEYFSISGNAFYKRCYEIGNIATSNRYRKQVSVGCPWRLDEEHLKRRHLQVDFVLPGARFYHGYQMFFLVCGEELRRPQTDTCSAESRTETGNAHEKYILAPRVARFYLCPKNDYYTGYNDFHWIVLWFLFSYRDGITTFTLKISLACCFLNIKLFIT